MLLSREDGLMKAAQTLFAVKPPSSDKRFSPCHDQEGHETQSIVSVSGGPYVGSIVWQFSFFSAMLSTFCSTNTLLKQPGSSAAAQTVLKGVSFHKSCSCVA